MHTGSAEIGQRIERQLERYRRESNPTQRTIEYGERCRKDLKTRGGELACLSDGVPSQIRTEEHCVAAVSRQNHAPHSRRIVRGGVMFREMAQERLKHVERLLGTG